MKFSALSIILIVFFSATARSFEKCDSYFAQELPQYQRWLEKENLGDLSFFLDELICEAQTKKIPLEKTLFFLRNDTPFFTILKKAVKTHGIVSTPLLKTMLMLLKQDFDQIFLHQIFLSQKQKNFQEAFFKASYFYFYLKPKQNVFSAGQLSRISFVLFKANPEKNYLESVLNLLLEIRNSKKDPEIVTKILEKNIPKAYSQRKLRQLLEEVPQ